MADLTEMYRFAAQSIPGYGDFAKGAAASQELMNNQLAYQKAREDLEAQRGLRALFQQNPNAGYSDVAQYSPALAQEMMKNQFATSKDLLEMQKTKSEIEEKQYKLNAEQEKELGHAHGAVVEAYDQLVSQGINPQQAATMVAPLAGQLTAQLAQRGIQTSKTFDPTSINPDVIENMRFSARKHQFPLTKDKMYQSQMESYGSGLGKAQAPVPAGVEMGPYGPRERPGLPTGMPRQPRGTGMGGAPSAQLSEGYERATAEDIPAIQQAYDNATDLNEKQQIGALLNQLKQQTQTAGSQFVTPQQESQLRMEEKQQEKELETKKQLDIEKGKQTIQEQALAKKATSAYDMLPDPDRIRNLIKGSISGDTEYWANRLGGVVGKSLEAGDITGALKVIEGQMADTVAMFPGAQSDKELEARMKTIGNPSGEISADTRLKAFDEWLQRMQKYAAQHADYDDTTLLDMVKAEKLTADQAMQIRKRRMSGGR